MSKAIYKLDLREDYPDLQSLRVNDVFLMQSFVDSGFRGADLKSLNFTRKNLEAITLADIGWGCKSKILFIPNPRFGDQ